jgi:hypothetical protein
MIDDTGLSAHLGLELELKPGKAAKNAAGQHPVDQEFDVMSELVVAGHHHL